MSAIRILIFTVAVGATMLGQGEAPRLFEQTGGTGPRSTRMLSSGQVRTIRIRTELLARIPVSEFRADLDAREGWRFALPLSDSFQPGFLLDRAYRTGDTVVYSGGLTGQPMSTAVLAVTAGEWSGRITTADGRSWEIASAQGGVLELAETSGQAQLRCGVAGSAGFDSSGKPEAATQHEAGALDSGRVIDILVVAPSTVVFAARGIDALRSRVSAAVEEANRSFLNSDIDVQYRLKDVREVFYLAAHNLEIDLSRLQRWGDGALDEIHFWRDALDADLVHMLTEDDFAQRLDGLGAILRPPLNPDGNSYSGFSVSAFSKLTAGNYTFTHETGHNLGLDHNPENSTPGADLLFGFSRGYRQAAAPPYFHDIMSYPCAGCRWINHWGNPFVLFDGRIPTGVVDRFDSARHIINVRRTVANWRVSGEEQPLPVDSRMLSPLPGSVLTSSDTRFEWQATMIGFYRLAIGDQGRGSENIYSSVRLSRPAVTVRVPADGRKLYVQLRYERPGGYMPLDYEYTGGGGSSQGATIRVNPDPIITCNGGSGRARIFWEAPGAREVQVRLGSASGTPMTGWSPPIDSAETGNWVRNGMVFVLIDESGRELARVAARVQCEAAVPPPPPPRPGAVISVSTVTDCANRVATVTWNAPGAGEVQIRIGSAAGTPMTGWSAESGSAETGPWVQNGLVFVLVNREGRELARAVARLQCAVAGLTATQNIPEDLQFKLEELRQAGHSVKCAAISPSFGWVVLYNLNDWVIRGVPDGLRAKLQDFRDQNVEIRRVAFTANGGWLILFGRNGYWAAGIPQAAFDRLGDIGRVNGEITDVAFTPAGGWAVIWNSNGFYYSGLPDSALNRMQILNREGRRMKSLAFGPNGRWVILTDFNGYWYQSVESSLSNSLTNMSNGGAELLHFGFSANGGWTLLGTHPTRGR